jgi:hypothetical protein
MSVSSAARRAVLQETLGMTSPVVVPGLETHTAYPIAAAPGETVVTLISGS